jgi:DNA-binding NarL/FixJ family response regulator
MKDEISQVKNIGDLLSVTENTLDEAGRAINTAKRLMDGRIRRMEELLEEIDSRLPDLERRVKSISASQKTHQQITAGGYETESYQKEKAADPDREEREIIARRNKRIIVMLEEGLSLEEIARQTGASMREIKLIQKFIK